MIKRIDLYNKSRVMGDYQARFCERLEGKFLRSTRRLGRCGACKDGFVETLGVFNLKTVIQ